MGTTVQKQHRSEVVREAYLLLSRCTKRGVHPQHPFMQFVRAKAWSKGGCSLKHRKLLSAIAESPDLVDTIAALSATSTDVVDAAARSLLAGDPTTLQLVCITLTSNTHAIHAIRQLTRRAAVEDALRDVLRYGNEKVSRTFFQVMRRSRYATYAACGVALEFIGKIPDNQKLKIARKLLEHRCDAYALSRLMEKLPKSSSALHTHLIPHFCTMDSNTLCTLLSRHPSYGEVIEPILRKRREWEDRKISHKRKQKRALSRK